MTIIPYCKFCNGSSHSSLQVLRVFWEFHAVSSDKYYRWNTKKRSCVMQVVKEKYPSLKRGMLGDGTKWVKYLCLRCFPFTLLGYACLQCKLKANNFFILTYTCYFPLLWTAYKNKSILKCIFYREIIWCTWLFKDFLSSSQLFYREMLHSWRRIYKLIYSEIHC